MHDMIRNLTIDSNSKYPIYYLVLKIPLKMGVQYPLLKIQQKYAQRLRLQTTINKINL